MFASDRDGASGLYEKAASGQGDEKLLLEERRVHVPRDLSRDGRFLAVLRARATTTDWDIWVAAD